jgi:hypothetical protein
MERYTAFDTEVVGCIAKLLGCGAREAAYRAGGTPVYELRLPSRSLGVDVLVVLWPGLRRVDVRAGGWSLVFKRVDAIELYPGVEVIFRRADPAGYLFVTVDGAASMCI